MYNVCLEKGLMSSDHSCFFLHYTLYLSLCTHTADPNSLNPFRESHCICLLDSQLNFRIIQTNPGAFNIWAKEYFPGINFLPNKGEKEGYIFSQKNHILSLPPFQNYIFSLQVGAVQIWGKYITFPPLKHQIFSLLFLNMICSGSRLLNLKNPQYLNFMGPIDINIAILWVLSTYLSRNFKGPIDF